MLQPQNISNSCKFITVILVLFSLEISAQYTNVINSNNPGFSESPYSVGSGVYQLESSFYLKKATIESNFSTPDFSGINLLFRTSFFSEKLEFNLETSYQKDRIAFKNIYTSSYTTSGLSKFTVGAKYLLFEPKFTDKSKEVRSWVKRHSFDNKRLIPSIAIYAGANFDFLNEIHQTGSISPRVGLLLQNDINNNFNIVTNLFYDKIATDYAEFVFVMTGTYLFSDRWSTFLENRTRLSSTRNDTDLATGIAFLYNKNFQLNGSFRVLAEGNARGFYTSFGLSYRLDNHKDGFFEVDKNGNKISPPNNAEKKGFFGRIFGGISSLFKKKQ